MINVKQFVRLDYRPAGIDFDDNYYLVIAYRSAELLPFLIPVKEVFVVRFMKYYKNVSEKSAVSEITFCEESAFADDSQIMEF